jgi:hypothetical protein
MAFASVRQPHKATGRSISAVSAVTSSGVTTVTVPSGVTWANLPGATAKVTVPANWKSALIISTLNADGFCTGGQCQARIVIDGRVANPAPGPRQAFFVGQRNCTIVRSLTIGPGTHTVSVQAGIRGAIGGLVEFDDWSLTVERARSS